MSAFSPDNPTEFGDKSSHRDVRASLRRLHSRRVLRRAAAGMTLAIACALAALCVIAFMDYGWGFPRAARIILLLLVLSVTLYVLTRNAWMLVRSRTLTDIAQEIGHVSGSRQNALVTYVENREEVGPKSEFYMLARLDGQARAELEKIDERVVAHRDGQILGVGAIGFMLLLILVLRLAAPGAFSREVRRVLWLVNDDALSAPPTTTVAANNESAAVAVDEFRLRVVPPAYSGLSIDEISGDAPVRALAGSRVEIEMHVTGAVEGATLTLNSDTFPMRSLGAGHFSGSFTPSSNGALEIRVPAAEGSAPAPTVRAIQVYDDARPEARLIEPNGDQILRVVPDAPIRVGWTARDDLGLEGVTLKYIKSRGLGDAAKFISGEIGVANALRASARDWQGSASLDLQRLDMQPGDTLVFWIEARDRSPLANNTGRSASLAIAIAAPELAKLNLSNLTPTEIARFLLSQRAIIILTEKLHSQRARLSKDELARRANDIAADQREFKNSFNDYITIEGGAGEGLASGSEQSIEERVRAAEDERTAPHFHGIPEPPTSSPASVKEMTYAIRAMWDAEEALVNTDTAQALKYEREALARLKRAQAAVRYVPPIVAQSKPIDLKRRYAGELADIRTRLEKLARRPQSPANGFVRAALADLYSAVGELQEALSVPVQARSGAIGRARDRARLAADRLVSAGGGDHAATIAEVAGQLRVVEVELSRLDSPGSEELFATRISKPLALLTQSAASLFAVVESHTRAVGGDGRSLLPTDASRASNYFRRLSSSSP